jgi:hypothetical protein
MQPRSRIPNQRDDRDVIFRQAPRTVTYSQFFLSLMSVGFNSIANEQTTAMTQAVGFDVIVRAAWTNLQLARVRFKELETQTEWSKNQVAVRGIIGGSNEVQPIRPLMAPIYLSSQNQIQGDWQNVGAEAAGSCVFFCTQEPDPRRGVMGDGQITVRKSRGYRLDIDLGATGLVSKTDPIHEDLLIWGAVTNCDDTITGQVFNDSSGFPWNITAVPFRALAGVDGQVDPTGIYPRPYYLPGNTQLRAQFNTAVTGNYLQFICERIYG